MRYADPAWRKEQHTDEQQEKENQTIPEQNQNSQVTHQNQNTTPQNNQNQPNTYTKHPIEQMMYKFKTDISTPPTAKSGTEKKIRYFKTLSKPLVNNIESIKIPQNVTSTEFKALKQIKETHNITL